MAVIKRDKPVVLTGTAASKFLANKRKNELEAKQYVSSILKNQDSSNVKK